MCCASDLVRLSQVTSVHPFEVHNYYTMATSNGTTINNRVAIALIRSSVGIRRGSAPRGLA